MSWSQQDVDAANTLIEFSRQRPAQMARIKQNANTLLLWRIIYQPGFAERNGYDRQVAMAEGERIFARMSVKLRYIKKINLAREKSTQSPVSTMKPKSRKSRVQKPKSPKTVSPKSKSTRKAAQVHPLPTPPNSNKTELGNNFEGDRLEETIDQVVKDAQVLHTDDLFPKKSSPRATKRKRADDDDATTVERASKRTSVSEGSPDEADCSNKPLRKKQREPFSFADASHPQCFGTAIKLFLKSRVDGADQIQYGSFDDGRTFCVEDGIGSTHHDEEMAWAHQIFDKVPKEAPEGWTPEACYKTMKYRFFLAVAMLTEQNVRAEEQAAAKGPGVKPYFINFNRTFAQLAGSRDVTTSTKMFKLFTEDFGWFPEMIITDPATNKKTVNPAFTNMFSAPIRKDLLDQLRDFEPTVNAYPEKHVVLPSVLPGQD